MPQPFAGFPRETLDFLGRLAENNNAEWFDTHRDEFDLALQPALIDARETHWRRLAPLHRWLVDHVQPIGGTRLSLGNFRRFATS